jgi:hypothetical protein
LSVTYTIAADLAATGLAGTAGFVVYNASGSVFQSRAASVSTVVQLGSSTSYIGTFSGVAGAYYLYIWDDGGSPPNYLPPGEVNPAVNVAAVANSPARDGDGTAAAVAAGTITLDANDPSNAANLVNWQVRILTATTGAGQVATVASSNPSTHVQTLAASWATTPTGVIVYELIPPSVTGSMGAVTLADGSITAAKFATDAISSGAVSAGAVTKFQAGLATPTNITGGTITTVVTTTNLTNAPTSGDFTAAMKNSLNAATPTVTLAAAQPLYAPAKVGDSMSLLPTAFNSVVIETGYNAKQALKVVLAACSNIILGNGTTAVTVGNAPLPAPTVGATTVINATMTGVLLVNGVPTAVDRTAIPSIQLSSA